MDRLEAAGGFHRLLGRWPLLSMAAGVGASFALKSSAPPSAAHAWMLREAMVEMASVRTPCWIPSR